MNTKNRFQRAAVCVLTFAALFAPTASWSAAGDLRVVIVVVDSLMPHEICGPTETRCSVKTPNLHALKEMGTWYEESRSVFSAETIPNHVAMITGRYPEFNGIPTNKYWNRISGGETEVGTPGEFEGDLALPSELEAPTLFRLIRGYPVGEGAACPDMVTASVMSKDYLYNIFSACDFGTGEFGNGEDFGGEACTDPRQTQAEYHWLAPFFIPESGHILDPFTIQAARAYLGDATPVSGLPPDFDASALLDLTGNLPSQTGGNFTEPAKETPAEVIFINLGDVDRLGHTEPSGSTTPTAEQIANRLPVATNDEGTLIALPFPAPQVRDGAILDVDTQIGQLVGTLGYDLSLGQVTKEDWNNTIIFLASDHAMDWKAINPESPDDFPGVSVSEVDQYTPSDGSLLREVANAGTTGLYLEDRTKAENWVQAVKVHKAIMVQAPDPDYPAEFAYFVYDPTIVTGLTDDLFARAEGGADALTYIRNNLIPGGKTPTFSEDGNLGLAKHENLGDIIVSAKPGFAYGSPLPGNHGSRITLHNTMLLTGGAAFINKGKLVTADGAPTDEVDGFSEYTSTVSHLWRGEGQSENIDIGATTAWLLGVLSPEQIEQQMDGRILYEAFDLSQPLPTPGSCGNVAEWAFVSVDEARELAGEKPRTKPRCKGCKVESNRPEGSKGKPRCKGCKVE